MKQNNTTDKNKKNTIIRIVTLALFVAISIAACIYCIILYNNVGAESFKDFVSELGVLGIAFMLFVQVLQVVFAIIPGEPIELVMGALYGTFGGVLLCLIGVAIGTALIFLLVKFWGRGFIESFTDSDKFKKLKFLQNPEKRDIIMFLLMFIPGTPKDLLTYFAPFTGIKIPRFIIIGTIARIPSIITSTYVGNSFAEGKIIQSIIVFAVVGVISVGGILIYNKIIDAKNKMTDKNEDL